MGTFKTRETTVRDGKERGLMKLSNMMESQEGKMGYILLWLLGIPIPVLILIFLLRGCD
jgi:hypothetical protein